MSIAEPDAVVEEADVARSDAELVGRFVATKEEAAFTELVRRHSGLVMSVCRRVLRDGHDIDDVFQATFLVFVRDAARVKKQASLASWLYGVAYRLAVRVAQQRQQRRETVLVDDTAVGDDILTELADRYDQQLVDAELNALPERYRQPLVLKYLAGKTPLEVASELKLTVGAVEGLLKRGKHELRARLMKRGVKLGAAVIAAQMTRQSVQAACPKRLIEETIRTGLAWNSTNPPPLDLISDRVLELTLKELATMTTLTKTGLTIGLTTGALALERMTAWRTVVKVAVPAVLLATSIALWPIGIPSIGTDAMTRYTAALGTTEAVKTNRGEVLQLPQDYADMLGWRELADSVGVVMSRLPASERADLTLVGGNYGQAGALAFYRTRARLPYPVSTAGDFWAWGPGSGSGNNVILVGSASSATDLAKLFSRVDVAMTLTNPRLVPEEQHVVIYHAQGAHAPLATLWPSIGPNWR